jgi:hypothetical protein
VGSILTATVNPTDPPATVTYQWQRASASTGPYTAISGATSSSYTPVLGDWTSYLEVVVTGTGSYTGTVTSPATAKVKLL